MRKVETVVLKVGGGELDDPDFLTAFVDGTVLCGTDLNVNAWFGRISSLQIGRNARKTDQRQYDTFHYCLYSSGAGAAASPLMRRMFFEPVR